MAGIVIRGIAPAFPGIQGVRGAVMTGEEVLKMTLGDGINSRAARRVSSAIEGKSGIKLRNIIDSSLLDPNTYLAAAAGHKLLKKLNISPSNVQGFIFASNTADYIFPPPGVPVFKSLGINPLKFANSATACSSFINALESASFWLQSGIVENVMVIACDITTRLSLPNNVAERLLFGDGAVAVMLERGKDDEKGGFVLTQTSFLEDSSDLVQHKNYRPYDFKREIDMKLKGQNAQSLFSANGHTSDNLYNLLFGDHHLNDEGYSILGSVDGREWAYIVMDIMDIDKLPDKIIPPQIGNTVILKGLAVIRDLQGTDISSQVVKNSFQEHGNTGAAAHPIALYEARESGELTKENSFGVPYVPLGGVNGYLAYDPNQEEIITFIKTNEEKRTPREDYKTVIERKRGEIEAASNGFGFRMLAKLGINLTRSVQLGPDGDYVHRIQNEIAKL